MDLDTEPLCQLLGTRSVVIDYILYGTTRSELSSFLAQSKVSDLLLADVRINHSDVMLADVLSAVSSNRVC